MFDHSSKDNFIKEKQELEVFFLEISKQKERNLGLETKSEDFGIDSRNEFSSEVFSKTKKLKPSPVEDLSEKNRFIFTKENILEIEVIVFSPSRCN